MLINQIRDGNAIVLVYMLPILVLTLTVHELCHGLAAYALGDKTAKENNRLSLNPLRHIDPMGFLLILFFGFGWAKPVGVDLSNLKKPKRDFALVAVAGPFSNFLLAFLCMVAAVAVVYAKGLGDWSDPVLAYSMSWPFLQEGISNFSTYSVLKILMYAVSINIGLGVFNMLPVPPLDGSRLVASFLPDNLYVKYLQLGRYGMLIILAVVAFGGFSNILGGAITKMFWGIFSAAEVIVRFFYGLLT